MIPINPTVIQQNLLNKMKKVNPQGYQFASYAMQNGGNFEPLVKQMLKQLSPEMKQQALNTAKNYGVSDSVLSELQNMK